MSNRKSGKGTLQPLSPFKPQKACGGTLGCTDRRYDKSQTDCQECEQEAYQAILDAQKPPWELHVPGFQGNMWGSWTAWQLGATNPEGESLSEFNDYYTTLKGGNNNV